MRRASAPAALVVAVVAALAARAAAADVRGGAIPPPPTRWVTDEARLLAPATVDALDRRLESYERTTGRQVVVWIGTTTGGVPLEEWAVRTFEAWGIGRKGHDDGVALFLFAQDRRVRIEVGYGLEGLLPDVRAARIVRERIVPRMAAGDPDGAVRAGVDGILAALGGEAGAPPQPDAAQPAVGQARPLSKLQLVLIAIVGIAVLLFVITHPLLALQLLFSLGSGGGRGRGGWSGGGGWGGGGGGGFSGGGGRSGGGGASGSW